jgi:hypothetical protein
MPCLQPITSVVPRPALAALMLAGAVLPSCGSPTGPQASPSPSASATPATPTPGGAVTGRYTLQINPAASCGAPRPSFTFTMDALPGGTTPHRGTQVVLTGVPEALEAEFVDENNALRGGVGTTADGVAAIEGFRLRMRVIASGALLRGTDGRGEVRSGTMMGTIGFSRPNDIDDTLGACVARDHTFTLSAR